MATCLHDGDLSHEGLPELLLGKKIQKRHLLYVFTSVLTSLSEAAFAWMLAKKLWRCWFRGTGTRFSSHWGVSQLFADAVLRHIFLEAGLEVRCAKCINVTIFLGENKRHIYASAHDFVWLRVCRSRPSPSNCTYSIICQSLVGLFGFCGIRPTENGVNKHGGLKRGLPTDV